jgi:hypothetical protein
MTHLTLNVLVAGIALVALSAANRRRAPSKYAAQAAPKAVGQRQEGVVTMADKQMLK